MRTRSHTPEAMAAGSTAAGPHRQVSIVPRQEQRQRSEQSRHACALSHVLFMHTMRDSVLLGTQPPVHSYESQYLTQHCSNPITFHCVTEQQLNPGLSVGTSHQQLPGFRVWHAGTHLVCGARPVDATRGRLVDGKFHPEGFARRVEGCARGDAALQCE
jgi:hypothetical protein